MHKEIRTSTDLEPRRYLAGLSFGPSSTCLAQILDDSAGYHADKKSSSPFEPLIVHVDTDLSPRRSSDEETPAQRLLNKYRQKYPHVSFDCIHLSKALSLQTIDWSTLLPDAEANADSTDDTEKLRRLFDALPSVTSRADVLRQLIRHLLIDAALSRGYAALLLGHSTSALSALTLAEVANGRGFSVPSQVNDGVQPILTYDPSTGAVTSRAELPVYFPLREMLRVELLTYTDIVPSLAAMKTELAAAGVDSTTGSSVVSHKDVSIEEVMQRYFDGVEGPYAGIVANVVRTAGKLERVAGAAACRLCGMALDGEGDDRWAGDLGADSGDSAEKHRGRLCYGCRRTVSG